MSILAAYIVPHPPLLIPEVGNGQETKVKDTACAYEKIAGEIAESKPDTILFITPHSIMYSDYIHISPGKGASGSFKDFGAAKPEFHTDYDTELASEIEFLCRESGFPAGRLGEKNPRLDHGTMVPMAFINEKFKGYKSLRISISGLSFSDHYKMGMIAYNAIENQDRNAVIIASGDLSHKLKDAGPYGYDPGGPVFDQKIVNIISSGDFSCFFDFTEEDCSGAGECGLRSFIMMAGILDKKQVSPELLSYEGPFGVGYAIGAFREIKPDKNRDFLNQYNEKLTERMDDVRNSEGSYAQLARLTLETYITDKRTIKPPQDLPDALLGRRAGVFVSIKKEGRLRGCIGTIAPTTVSIADEIIQNAISAGVGDTRFDPVTPEELPTLVYSVDVLDSPEKVPDETFLDPENYGVIVSYKGKRGLLLPNLEGVDTVAKQLEIALQKGNIPPTCSYEIERFKVVRHK